MAQQGGLELAALLDGPGDGRPGREDVVLVISQPDRPAGRGMKLQPSPVKQWALDQGLNLAQPRSLRRPRP